jgi:hypothetical protein
VAISYQILPRLPRACALHGPSDMDGIGVGALREPHGFTDSCSARLQGEGAADAAAWHGQAVVQGGATQSEAAAQVGKQEAGGAGGDDRGQASPSPGASACDDESEAVGFVEATGEHVKNEAAGTGGAEEPSVVQTWGSRTGAQGVTLVSLDADSSSSDGEVARSNIGSIGAQAGVVMVVQHDQVAKPATGDADLTAAIVGPEALASSSSGVLDNVMAGASSRPPHVQHSGAGGGGPAAALATPRPGKRRCSSPAHPPSAAAMNHRDEMALRAQVAASITRSPWWWRSEARTRSERADPRGEGAALTQATALWEEIAECGDVAVGGEVAAEAEVNQRMACRVIAIRLCITADVRGPRSGRLCRPGKTGAAVQRGGEVAEWRGGTSGCSALDRQ